MMARVQLRPVDLAQLAIRCVCSPAIGADGNGVYARTTLCIANVALMDSGRVSTCTDLASMWVGASGLRVSKSLTLLTLRGRGGGVQLFRAYTDAEDVEPVPDGLQRFAFGSESNANGTSLLLLSSVGLGQPVWLTNNFETLVEGLYLVLDDVQSDVVAIFGWNVMHSDLVPRFN